jgi:hypothetical protein
MVEERVHELQDATLRDRVDVARFDPQLVICSQPNTVDPGGRPAWVELPPDPVRLAEIFRQAYACLNT